MSDALFFCQGTDSSYLYPERDIGINMKWQKRTDFDTLFYFYLHIYNAVHPDRIHNFTDDPDKKYKISFIDNYAQFSLEAQLYT